MKKLILLFWLALFSTALAQQITGPIPTNALACAFNTAPPTVTSGFWGYAQCDSTGKLITSGGGGGLSVQDQATWTQGTSNMTPQGCEFNDTSTLASGTQGTTRCTTKRAQVIDIDSVGSQIHNDLTSPVPIGTNTIGNVKIVDTAGTNLATVKPASTAPVAADTSVVTALNPNSPGIIATGGATTALSVPVALNSQYPVNSVTTAPTAITAASGNVANASAAATLAGVASKTTFITGFEITSDGASVALCVNPTVTGTVTGTLTYTYCAPAGVLVMATPLIVPFPLAIPASAVNTAIVVTLPALGTGSANATVVAHGYQL